MAYRAVSFHTEEGEPRRAVVGHQFEGGRKVLAIGSSNDVVTIMQEGGAMLSIAAGAVVQAEEMDAPVVPPRPVLPRERATDSARRRPAILVHGQFGPRTIAVGDTLDDYGSMVRAIIPGDPTRVWLVSGAVLEFSAGQLVKYLQE